MGTAGKRLVLHPGQRGRRPDQREPWRGQEGWGGSGRAGGTGWRETRRRAWQLRGERPSWGGKVPAMREGSGPGVRQGGQGGLP